MLCMEPPRILCVVADVRSEQKNWIGQILAATGWTLTELARRTGMHQTTLTRFWNDPLEKATLSAKKIKAISEATGWQAYAPPDPARRKTDLTVGDGELLPVGEVFGNEIDAAIRGLIAGRNNVYPLRVKTRALETAGYLPGDLCVVDMNAIANKGDVVCAQIYEFDRGEEALPRRAETVLRIFEPPHLVSASMDPGARAPYYVDNRHVAIMGVVIGMFRPRAAA